MTDVQPPLHTRVRRTAFDLWRGPNFLQTRDENDLIDGNRVLRLAIRKGLSIKPMIEARAVYAILEESFPDTRIEPDSYDFQSYQPSLSLPLRS